jgi:hypothetical protein
VEALNGITMFGLTTGFLYTVFHAMMRRTWETWTEKSPAAGGKQTS